MKHTLKAALAVAVLAGSVGVAKADVTLSGPTGLFLNPTAQIASKAGPEVAVDYQRYSNGGYHANDIGIVGAFQLADKLEINGGYHHLGNDDGNIWNIGAKYQLMNQAEKGIGVAVGADYSKFSGGGSHNVDVYAAATKAFDVNADRAPIQGTLGVRYNDNDGGNSKVDIFAGVAVPLTRTGEFSLIGELGSKRSEYDDTSYALGVRYHPVGSAFNVGAGVARNIVFAQVGYQFGK